MYPGYHKPEAPPDEQVREGDGRPSCHLPTLNWLKRQVVKATYCADGHDIAAATGWEADMTSGGTEEIVIRCVNKRAHGSTLNVIFVQMLHLGGETALVLWNQPVLQNAMPVLRLALPTGMDLQFRV